MISKVDTDVMYCETCTCNSLDDEPIRESMALQYPRSSSKCSWTLIATSTSIFIVLSTVCKKCDPL